MRHRFKQRMSIRETQMVENHLKKCSVSVDNREVYLRFHLTPIIMAKFKDTVTTLTQKEVKSDLSTGQADRGDSSVDIPSF